MNILIIDDEKVKIQPLIDGLELLNHNVSLKVTLDCGFNELKNPKNKFKYDLVLLDYLFKNNLSKQFENGEELAGKLMEIGILTSIVLFTATADSVDIVNKVIGEHRICLFFRKDDFARDIIGSLNKIIQNKGFINNYKIRTEILNSDLRDYFNSLYGCQLIPFQNELTKGLDADWTNKKFEIILNGGSYFMIDLFSSPFSTNDIENINKKLSPFAYSGNRNVKFSRTFKEDTKVQFEKYLNLPIIKFETLQKLISKKALDYYINILFLINKTDKNNNNNVTDLYMNRCNSISKATLQCKNTKISDSTSWNIFINKLILRRVLLNYVQYIGFETRSNFDKVYLACCLRDTNTCKIKSFEETNTGNSNVRAVFDKGLGLTVEILKDFNNIDDSVLIEEKKWVNLIGKEAKNIFIFLEGFEVPNDILNTSSFFTNPSNVYDFECLTQFENYMQRLKNNLKPIVFNQIINFNKDYLNTIDKISHPVIKEFFDE